jgi:hypothetical protein
MTTKALTEMGVQHYIVVEPAQVDEYTNAIKRVGALAEVLPLDMGYKHTYDLCDDKGQTISTGAGPARNFAWDHSIASGHKWHWVMDDNHKDFHRLNRNVKARCYTGAFFYAMEEFAMRYSNLAMCGPNYEMFCPRKVKVPPFIMNTRIYSCNLIRNDIPFRWRGRYNEDTILSLDILKRGWCTVQFNAFLANKMPTQSMRGGNTDELYHGGGQGKAYSATGTTDKSQQLVDVHPDVSRVVWRYGRIHHHVDYSRFKQGLVRRPGVAYAATPNEYGMVLVQDG